MTNGLAVQPGVNVARAFALRSTSSLHSSGCAPLPPSPIAQPTDDFIEKLCSALNFLWLQKKKAVLEWQETYAARHFISWRQLALLFLESFPLLVGDRRVRLAGGPPKRAAPKAAALKKLGYCPRVGVDTMSLLYKTIQRPCREYASIACVWDNCSAADSRRLKRLQLSVAMAVMHQRQHPSMSKSQLLKQLGWPTLAWRRRRAKLIYFWKLVNNQGPPRLSSRIPKSVNNRCEHSLRNTGTVELPACSSSLHLSSVIPSSCLLWNSLPPDVTSSSSVSSFTRKLDSHFSFDRFTLGLS